ncbi:hypothetical protein [Yinghuangia sp. YIM S09857]|uniref:hypothetical protein n=1 Tax=Yinghuangia sp. YIM S09857 TaxID=3436929 RepID=UPI003F52DCAC
MRNRLVRNHPERGKPRSRLTVLTTAALLALGALAAPGPAATAAPAESAARDYMKCGFSHHRSLPQYGDWYYNCTWDSAQITIKWADGHVSWKCTEAGLAYRLGDLNSVESAWIAAKC